MNTKLPDPISTELIIRHFSGLASKEEELVLMHWANTSVENKELLRELHTLWADTGAIRTPNTNYKKRDIDAAWQKVLAQKPVSPTNRTYTLLKIAAIILVMVGVGCLVRFLQDPQKTYSTHSTVGNIQLEDGSVVALNEASQLTYPGSFSTEERRVALSGEAFFEITPNPNQPFIIEAGPTQIRVLGTSFNVKVDDKSVTVIVETGTVQFTRGNESVLIVQGEKATFSNTTETLSPAQKTSSVGLEQFWRTKSLRFSGEKLPEVIRTIEEAYATQIKLGSEKLSDCSLSVTFNNDTLENILDVIALTLNLEISQTDQQYILTGKGCTDY